MDDNITWDFLSFSQKRKTSKTRFISSKALRYKCCFVMYVTIGVTALDFEIHPDNNKEPNPRTILQYYIADN